MVRAPREREREREVRVDLLTFFCVCKKLLTHESLTLLHSLRTNKNGISREKKKKSYARSIEKHKIMGIKLSGAAKRKKKKEVEDAIAEAKADLERLKLGPTKLWTGLVTHHKDIFVSHVLPKLNRTEQFFFGRACRASHKMLEYAGIKERELVWYIDECTSISTLDYAWNKTNWGERFNDGTVIDQAWFCYQVARTNKLELLKWAREEKKCEWGERTINIAALIGNLEMLKYCFANDCPCDERAACLATAAKGHIDCLRFLFDKVKPSRETEKRAAKGAAQYGQLDILKYFVGERKMSDDAKLECVGPSAFGRELDCLKYMVEEAKVPLDWQHIAYARFFEKPEYEHYLREKGCPEPTDEEYALFLKRMKKLASSRQ